jgi:hypothetical protein
MSTKINVGSPEVAYPRDATRRGLKGPALPDRPPGGGMERPLWIKER